MAESIFNIAPPEMTGASSSSDGTGGTVPAPLMGDEGKVLMGSGTWETPPISLPSGGASGTVLQKNSATDYDVAWASISTDNVIKVTTAIAIPASGSSASYNVSGLTANHELIRWNFSSSAENWPPVNLTVTTYAGYFTIQNTSGTTNESIKPMFAVPVNVTATKR